jgi:hypothetical protein
MVVERDITDIEMTTFNYHINRPPSAHWWHTWSSYYPHLLLVFPLTYLCSLPSCSELDSPWLFSPNIWHPLYSKLEDNPNNTTKMSQPTSPSRRRPTPILRPKPSTLPPPIHSNPLHHRQKLRTVNLWWHSWSPATPTSQHVHHRSGLQQERQRR